MNAEATVPLAVLLIEDSPSDAELVVCELRREWPGLTWRRVQTEDEFVAALDERAWQIVLSDFELPGFAPARALAIMKARGLPTPLVVVSGVLSTEDAVALMRCGAVDFVSKDDLPRLRGTVHREMERCAARRKAAGNEVRLAAAQQTLRVLQRAVEQSPVSVILTSRDGTIEYVNATLCALTGFAADELIGSNPRVLQSGQTPLAVYQDLWDTVLSGREWRGEMLNRKKNGELFWEYSRIAPIFDDDGEIAHLVCMKEDITERKRHLEALDRMASTDALTGLPNRPAVSARLAEYIVRASAAGDVFAVLCLDLDQFRMVNDSLGHAAGDALLVSCTARIRQCLRQADTVARTGGDEFVLVLPEVRSEHVAAQVASRLLTDVGMPVTLMERELAASCSIGIAMYPRDGADADALLRNADAAMFQAKQEGRNTFRFYSRELNARLERRLQIETHLRRAIERGELALHYQPQVSLRTGEISGAEALLRWTSAALGSVSPAEFIPAAEESGLILPIGRWVLETACAQSVAWARAGLRETRVAVNVSTRQFADPNLVPLVAKVLDEAGLKSEFLELEITESALMHDAAGAVAVVLALKKLGVRVSLDDFGTGFSSLAYLSRLPLDALKIDQSFVRDITTNPTNAMIATATTALAHNLGLNVVAEGVETEGQANYLRTRGCDEMQGYLYSRPLPAEAFAALLRERSAPRERAGDEVLPTLLLVDDEPNILHALRRLMRRDGYRILMAESAAAGLELLAENQVHVVVSDQRMPETSGTEFLSKVKDLYPETVRFVLSGYTDLASVTEAINRGAIYRFLTKPWDDDALREEIRGAFRHQQMTNLAR